MRSDYLILGLIFFVLGIIFFPIMILSMIFNIMGLTQNKPKSSTVNRTVYSPAPAPPPRPPTYASPKFCSQCGSPLRENYRFCENCGFQIY